MLLTMHNGKLYCNKHYGCLIYDDVKNEGTYKLTVINVTNKQIEIKDI